LWICYGIYTGNFYENHDRSMSARMHTHTHTHSVICTVSTLHVSIIINQVALSNYTSADKEFGEVYSGL